MRGEQIADISTLSCPHVGPIVILRKYGKVIATLRALLTILSVRMHMATFPQETKTVKGGQSGYSSTDCIARVDGETAFVVQICHNIVRAIVRAVIVTMFP